MEDRLSCAGVSPQIPRRFRSSSRSSAERERAEQPMGLRRDMTVCDREATGPRPLCQEGRGEQSSLSRPPRSERAPAPRQFRPGVRAVPRRAARAGRRARRGRRRGGPYLRTRYNAREMLARLQRFAARCLRLSPVNFVGEPWVSSRPTCVRRGRRGLARALPRAMPAQMGLHTVSCPGGSGCR